MKGAVIYARYSCEKQNDQSIESQLRVCRDFAEKSGLTIIDTYADRATTGTNDNRAEFQRMLSDAEKPVLWDIVLVYAINRFGRNSIEIALIEKIIVFDDKIQIFFKYTKTSPEDTPWEMPSYPGSDSSNMVDLRRVLRATCYSQLLSRSARCARAAIKCSAVLTKKVDFC